MEITDVRIFPRNGHPNLRAFASLVLDGSFAVKDIKVVEGERGLFVSMPSRRLQNGKYLDVAHPITREMRDLVQARVLEAYRTAEVNR